METILSFGYWLRRRRKALDLTQQELAKRVHCAVVMIKKIEADERRPSAALAEQLAIHLAIPLEDHALFVRVARGEIAVERLPSLPLAPTAHTVPHPIPYSLRQRSAQIIGRASAIATIRDWLHTADARLISLVGPPGIGKTCLALHVAGLLYHDYPDGVAVVLLAQIQHADQVLPALARAVGVSETGRHTLLDRMKLAVRDRHMVIILDNYEHVLASTPLLADLLAHCLRLHLLVTSREVLRLQDERVFRVPPLELPPQSLDLSLTAHNHSDEASPAVALFVERAQAVRPEFVLTAQHAACVVDICRRLDGVPLALELAAGWMALLDPPAIRDQLIRHGIGATLSALGQTVRDLPARQQTFYAAVDWSYSLLTSTEQRLLRALAVFVGGWSFAAATAITNDFEQTTHPAGELMQGLYALLSKSLIQRQDGREGETRFSMLELIREYAREQLPHDPQTHIIHQRHAEYYRAMVLRAVGMLHGPEQRFWLDQLEMEHANIRAALQWDLTRAEHGHSLQLAGATAQFWVLRGHLEEGRRWLEAAIATCDSALLDANYGHALLQLGIICFRQHQYQRARREFERSLHVFDALHDQRGSAWARYGLHQLMEYAESDEALRQSARDFAAVGDQVGQAEALNTLGARARWRGAYRQAAAYHTESLALSTLIGDGSGQAWARALLGKVRANQGAYAAARAQYEASLTLLQAAGDQFRPAWVMQGLAEVHFWNGDLARAGDLFRNCFHLFQRMGDEDGMAWAQYNQGRVALGIGELDAARAYLEASLRRFRHIDDQANMAWVLTVLGQVLHLLGETPSAYHCFGTSLRLHQQAASLHGTVTTLEGVAHVLAEHQPRQAVLLWGAAAAARTTASIPLSESDRADITQHLAQVEPNVGSEAFAEAWSTGQTLPLDTVVAQVMRYITNEEFPDSQE